MTDSKRETFKQKWARAAVRALLFSSAVGGALPAQDSSAALLDRAARAYASVRTVRAQFAQTLTNPGTNSVYASHGEFFQRGPSHFAFRFSDPPGDAIVSDGTAVWVYLPSAAKGQVLKMPGQAGAALDFLTQLLAAPREHYTVAARPDTSIGPHPVAAFALAPKDGNAPFTHATLWVGRDDLLLWQLEAVEPSGLVRRVTFSAIRTNVELPHGALAFTVPEGVRVIDQAALFGRKP
ncbi:MAG: outer membrane lipoprotein carrier protein LolA [Gemmatimonadales bacterium]